MKTIQIKTFAGSVLFEHESENNTLRKTLKEAVNRGADLRDADLRDANLEGANLEGADLRDADLEGAYLEGADLEGADLRDADLRDADLEGANLEGADLRDADLRDANLEGANLRDADLRDADLEGANLEGADLEGADLEGANLRPIKNDFFIVLLHAIPEIPYLKQNIVEGNINGSTYLGECACLSGTLHNGAIKHNGAHEKELKKRIIDCRDSSRPIERFFFGISKGDTPETNQFSKLALAWVEEFEQLLEIT